VTKTNRKWPLLPVGWRWYQPHIGRFVQREPLGIAGGLNVYQYAGSHASGAVDPLGLKLVYDVIVIGDRIIVHWYEEHPWWKIWKKNRLEFLRTQSYRLHPADRDGSALSEDCDDAIRRHQGAAVICVSTGIAELDEELRKAAKRLAGKGGVGGKPWIIVPD